MEYKYLRNTGLIRQLFLSLWSVLFG